MLFGCAPWLPVHIPFEIWQTKSGQHVSFYVHLSLSSNAMLFSMGVVMVCFC